MKKNTVVLLSGGIGKRFSCTEPKQFYKISGKTIIELTLEKFLTKKLFSNIIIVSHKDYIEKTKQVLKKLSLKNINVIEGGEERFFSSYNAIKFLEKINKNNNFNILIHDIVRPFVEKKLINDLIDNLISKKAEAVIPVTNSNETIYLLDDKKNFINILDRKKVVFVQTPQAFKFNLLLDAYNLAFNNKDFKYTDDFSVLKKYNPGVKTSFIQGCKSNIKITYNQDLCRLL